LCSLTYVIFPSSSLRRFRENFPFLSMLNGFNASVGGDTKKKEESFNNDREPSLSAAVSAAYLHEQVCAPVQVYWMCRDKVDDVEHCFSTTQLARKYTFSTYHFHSHTPYRTQWTFIPISTLFSHLIHILYQPPHFHHIHHKRSFKTATSEHSHRTRKASAVSTASIHAAGRTCLPNG